MKKDYYLFWIRSSKGTDSKVVYSFKVGTTKDVIKDRLEQYWLQCLTQENQECNNVR